MQALRTVMFKGLVTLIPTAFTLYVIYWIIVSVEGLVAPLIPESWYLFGTGWLLVLLIIMITGVLMHLFLFETLFAWATSLLERIPLIKSVYSSLRDLLDFLTNRGRGDLGAVVSVRLDDDTALIGFVTRQQAGEWTGWHEERGATAVYLPMSYQVGGYTLLIANDRLRPLDMEVEAAMRFVLTAGVRRGGREESDKRQA